jgi:hypothetical protein
MMPAVPYDRAASLSEMIASRDAETVSITVFDFASRLGHESRAPKA